MIHYIMNFIFYKGSCRCWWACSFPCILWYMRSIKIWWVVQHAIEHQRWEILKFAEEPSSANLGNIIKFGRLTNADAFSPINTGIDVVDFCLSSWSSNDDMEDVELEEVRLKLAHYAAERWHQLQSHLEQCPPPLQLNICVSPFPFQPIRTNMFLY